MENMFICEIFHNQPKQNENRDFWKQNKRNNNCQSINAAAQKEQQRKAKQKQKQSGINM